MIGRAMDASQGMVRWKCGRWRVGGWLPHWNRFRPRYPGESQADYRNRVPLTFRPGRLYDRLYNRREILMCWTRRDHWKLTLRPERFKLVHGHEAKAEDGIVRFTPGRHVPPSVLRKNVKWVPVEREISLPSVELGHVYWFDHYEPLMR